MGSFKFVGFGIVLVYRYFFIRTWQDGISEQRAHYTNVLVSCILWRVAVRSQHLPATSKVREP